MVSRTLIPEPEPTRSSVTTRIRSKSETSTTPSSFDCPAGMETPPTGVRNARVVFDGCIVGAVPMFSSMCGNFGGLLKRLATARQVAPGLIRLPLSGESRLDSTLGGNCCQVNKSTRQWPSVAALKTMPTGGLGVAVKTNSGAPHVDFTCEGFDFSRAAGGPPESGPIGPALISFVGLSPG
jgi:hypothetical protein